MLEDDFAIGGIDVLHFETGFAEGDFVIRRDDQMVNPFEKVRRRFIAHARGELGGEFILAEESLES